MKAPRDLASLRRALTSGGFVEERDWPEVAAAIVDRIQLLEGGGHDQAEKWRAEPATYAKRDLLLLRIAEKFFVRPTPTATDKALAAALQEYHEGEWVRRTQMLDTCPHEPASRKALFWEVLKLIPHAMTHGRIGYIRREHKQRSAKSAL